MQNKVQFVVSVICTVSVVLLFTYINVFAENKDHRRSAPHRQERREMLHEMTAAQAELKASLEGPATEPVSREDLQKVLEIISIEWGKSHLETKEAIDDIPNKSVFYYSALLFVILLIVGTVSLRESKDQRKVLLELAEAKSEIKRLESELREQLRRT